jgi:hypothetical protein
MLLNLLYLIAPFNNMDHHVSLELFAEVALDHLSLFASNLGKKASYPGAV